jgi:antitoxin component of MazEF toxin-antitoxin module
MTVLRRVKRVGGSLGVLIPRDIAEAMNVTEGSEVRLTLVGRQVVVEPADDTLEDGAFRRAFAAVLRRHDHAFELLAAHDSGKPLPKAKAR